MPLYLTQPFISGIQSSDMRPEDEGFWPEQPKVGIPTYCTPEDVAMAMDLPDASNPYGFYQFSDMSHPSRDMICNLIVANEDKIDMRTRRSWRVNYVKDYITDIPDYQWDEAGWRIGYHANGGYYVQLRKNILPWDPRKGDRVYLRRRFNEWANRSEMEPEEGEENVDLGDGMFWFDYKKGRMFLRMSRFQPKFNAICVSYRYGSEEPVPDGIRRLCALMTAVQVLNMQTFAIKVGLGGDIAGIKDQMLKSWNDEINELLSMYQRSGSVHGVPQR